MQPRYRLNFFFDPGSGAVLWSADAPTRERFGVSANPELLPLSAATRTRIVEIAEWFDGSLNWDYPPDPGPFRADECARFNDAARALLEALRAELGSDFDLADCFTPLTEDPDLDAYLRDPKGFRRRGG